VAKETLLVLFDLGGAELEYRPGQYFWVELLDPPYQDEQGPRRHITAVTSPSERGVIGLCTRLRKSAFKRSLAELPLGAEVEVEPPQGAFVLPEESSRPLVFVAGGIGITPFRSMLRYIEDERLPHHVTLIYSSRNRESAAFLDELEGIERANPNARLIVTMTDDEDWSGERRRIDADFLRDRLGGDLNESSYMVAGPPGMVAAVSAELEKTGVDSTLIVTESFSGY
jgi:ferredoxin-NADP reductase